MTRRPRHPTDHWTWQFTLRGLFRWIFILAVMLGVGRWVYVRTYLQRQIVKELRGLNASVGNIEYSWLFEPTAPGQGTYYGPNDFVPPGCVVRVVHLQVPFRSDDDALRVNAMLRQLPHLRDVWVHSSLYRQYEPNLTGRAGSNLLTAVDGLKLRGIIIRQPLGREAWDWICQSSSISAVTFNRECLPPPAEFQAICKTRHVTRISIEDTNFTREHLQCLASAKHLRHVCLSWRELDLSIRPEDFTALGRLANCDVELMASNVSDSLIRDGFARLPNLTRLYLVFEAPSDDAVSALASAPRLRFLSLQDATVSDEAIIALADSRSLEELNVAGTDASKEALLQLRRCSTLRMLTVSSSQKLKPLIDGLPGVNFGSYWSPPSSAKRRKERRISAEAARQTEAERTAP